MILDETIKLQLKEYLSLLEDEVVIKKYTGTDEVSLQMDELLEELNKLSSKIHIEEEVLNRMPSFKLTKRDTDSGITFAGVPLGHEFSSLVLALLQVSGRPPKMEQEVVDRIKLIKRELSFETYISLSCHNCPDVVQALNMMSILNPHIQHTMIDGNVFRKEVEDKEIMAVPSIYLNGEYFNSGRITLEDVLQQLGIEDARPQHLVEQVFDSVVVGAGPGGCSAAIYMARKGLKTALIAKHFGGQVTETLSIENLISLKYIEGPNLGRNLEEHVKQYDIEVISNQLVTQLGKVEDRFEVVLENRLKLKAKAVILATGAKWRNLNVPGEVEFKNKGVAYCPHCDGPLYKGKKVAVVGGGNSGVEAAIDLSQIAEHVYLLEFMPQLKADEILQSKLKALNNVTILTHVKVQEIKGKTKVEEIMYQDTVTEEIQSISLEGVFIQIGLSPNTDWLKGQVSCNKIGEIIVDRKGRTNLEGIFAAGDCTDSPYKQIIIAMGSGATAALSAFDYLMNSYLKS